MIKTPRRACTDGAEQALLDTSVVVDLAEIDRSLVPEGSAISAITLAELAIGPHAAVNAAERSRRQDTLQRAESAFVALPVDVAVARAYARLYVALPRPAPKPRGRRGFDLLIAATALAADLPLYTRNLRDFVGFEELIEIVIV